MLVVREKDDRRLLLVVFDGVIHSATSDRKDATVIPDPPVDGAFQWLARALEHFRIAIHSFRSHEEGGIYAMHRWFKLHGWPAQGGVPEALEFPVQRPTAFLTIDDRAFLFKGDWPDPVQLTRFQSWQEVQKESG